LLLVVAVALEGKVAGAGQPYASRHENVLGTTLDLVIRAETPAAADRAEAAVLAEIDRLAGILSTWDANSEFSRWYRGPPRPTTVAPSPGVFGRAITGAWLRRAFNPAQAICRVWKEVARTILSGRGRMERAVQWAGSPPGSLTGHCGPRSACRIAP
jgi:hypothetical protein